MRFNVPPGWPVPPDGWVPPVGGRPDPSWPAAPAYWQWWVEDSEVPRRQLPSYEVPPPDPAYATPASSRLDEKLIKAVRWGRQWTGGK